MLSFLVNICSSRKIVFEEGVVEIKDREYQNQKDLEGSLIIPNTVKRIGKWAFGGCSGFKGHLVLPDMLEFIGFSAFYDCCFKGDIIIPDSVTVMEGQAFAYCKSFTGKLKLSKSLKRLEDLTFYGCTHLKGSINISNSLEYIGLAPFISCLDLESVFVSEDNKNFTVKDGILYNKELTRLIYCPSRRNCTLLIPDTVINIETGAFFGCKNVTGYLTFPKGTEIIGDSAFTGCCGLKGDLIIPNKVNKIFSYTFAGCLGLNGKLVIPNTISIIEERAFYGCKLTGNLTIPDSIISIGNYVFEDCCCFTGKLKISCNVETIGSGAFIGCLGIEGIDVDPKNKFYSSFDGILLNKNQTDIIRCPGGKKGQLQMPESVKKILSDAFSGCDKLTGDLILPKNVMEIEYRAFGKGLSTMKTTSWNYITLSFTPIEYPCCSGFDGCLNITGSIQDFSECINGCYNIKTIDINANHPNLCSYDGIIFNKDKSELIRCILGKVGTIIIPESVETIGNSAFYFCMKIDNVNFSVNSKVKTIGYSAFMNCIKLSGVFKMPDSVCEIKERAFSNSGFSKIEFGINCSLKTIEDGAFIGALLKEIELPNKITIISTSLFAHSSLESIKIPSEVKAIKSNAFYFCENLTHVALPESVEEIGDKCFSYSGIESIFLNKGLKTIGKEAFYFCTSIKTSLTIPESIVEIGDRAFGYSLFVSVLFKSSQNPVIYGEGCFENSKITRISLPVNSFSKITLSKCFCYNCKELKGELLIPKTVGLIEELAFASCGITSLSFQNSEVPPIGKGAFFMCQSLIGEFPSVKFKEIGERAFGYTKFGSIPSIRAVIIKKEAFINCGVKGHVSITAEIIEEKAFYGCSLMESVEVNGEQSLKPCIFIMCKSLKSINFVPNVIKPHQNVSIGYRACAFCTSLETFTWSKKITTIEEGAFFGCISLLSVLPFTIMSKLVLIGKEAFINCVKLAGELSFPESLKVIDDNAFVGCQFSGSLIIPDGVERIGSHTFFNCNKFKGNLVIGESCKEIGNSAFAMCNGFSGNVIIGENVRSIGSKAFFGCSSLSGILTIPKSVVIIKDYAFSCCPLFSGLVLNENIEEIGDGAFSECVGMNGKLIIPSTTKLIGPSAFYHCIGFKQVSFGSKETKANKYSFYKMSNECFSNVPESFKNSNQNIYKSDKIDNGFYAKYYYLSCSTYKTINILVVIASTIAGTGIIGPIASFAFNFVNNLRSTKNMLTAIFKEIVSSNVDSLKNNDKVEEECINDIINQINSRVCEEFQGEATEKSMVCYLSSVIDEEWPTIRKVSRQMILDKSFDGVLFKQSFKLKCRCKSKHNDDNSDIDLSQVNVSLI